MDKFLLQEGNPVLETNNDHAVYVRMMLEGFNGVDYDGLTVQLEKLFRPRPAIHALTCATRENERIVHCVIVPFINRCLHP